MPKNIFLLLVVGFVLAIISGCNQEPVFPVEPRVEVLDIQPRVVKSLQDSILIRFRFEDGDGNIGLLPEDGADKVNLTIIDSRINDFSLPDEFFVYEYRIPNLTPDTRNPSIQGEFTVKIDFTKVFSGFATSEEFRYQIKLEDRDGNIAKPINGNDEAVYTDFIEVVR
ncbi:MAG: hypothetical protein AAFY71_17970 [Bacteroidota bacterium]